MSLGDAAAPPRAFLSYSWDGDEHENWVLQLGTRLRADGVDVVLDRWDTRLGSDLTLFMEQAGDTEFRVVAVVSDTYREKADGAEGGVGYERRVITPTLLDELTGHRVIPVLRNNDLAKLPRFFGAAKYVDMRQTEQHEVGYYQLLQDLHGMEATPKPPLGRNPFQVYSAEEVQLAVRQDPNRYAAPALTGNVSFNYENNDGRYEIGAGERSFNLNFSTAGPQCVYVYTSLDVQSVALAPHVSDVSQVGDPTKYDSSSRTRLIKTGDGAVLRNKSGYWAAIFVDQVMTRETSPTGEASMGFRYHIPEIPEITFD